MNCKHLYNGIHSLCSSCSYSWRRDSQWACHIQSEGLFNPTILELPCCSFRSCHTRLTDGRCSNFILHDHGFGLNGPRDVQEWHSMHTELLIYKNIYLFLKHFTGLLILTEIFYTPQSSVDDDLVLNWLYSLSELLSKPTWAGFFFSNWFQLSLWTTTLLTRMPLMWRLKHSIFCMLASFLDSQVVKCWVKGLCARLGIHCS